MTLLLALGLLLTALEQPRLQVTVEGSQFKFEPAYVRLRIRVEPDADNRLLRVELDAAGFYRSADEDLPGDRARRTRWVEFKAVPAGEYAVAATVYRQTARDWHAQGRLTVIGVR